MLATDRARDEEKTGIIVYLRSLEPEAQGEIDFGGRFGGGGGSGGRGEGPRGGEGEEPD